ncbi:MAG TPA: hypothetical protein VF145_09850 [Chitinophagaceae bacterium]
MAINIVEAIQSRLGAHSISKINVNATHQSETNKPEKTDHARQGAVSAVLVALYRFGKTDEGAANLAHNTSGNWLQTIFVNKDEIAVSKVAAYAGISNEEARQLMETTASEAVSELHRNLGEEPTPAKVQSYLASQRHNILVYLPAELEMGKLLDDPALDDRTNKMEGPVSSFLHWIENLMAPADRTNEEAFRRDDEFFSRKHR